MDLYNSQGLLDGRHLGKDGKECKKVFKKMLGKSSLTFRELQTISSEIEAILNDRPITYYTLALNILILSIFYISMDLSTNHFAHFSGC